ncbi:MAG: cryptochrome/photolyase family protein, partial [Rhodothermales bacterium]|nr:cryptochrome/photolyase family protein [Rhodothermales bacterium]
VFVMGEVRGEITRHPNHRQRVILFLSAMRHFRDDLSSRGYRVEYQQLSDSNPAASLAELVERNVSRHSPEKLVFLEPGRADIQRSFESIARDAGVRADVIDDDHFLLTRTEFAEWAQGRKSLVAESFYRMMRRKTGYLMDGGEPEGGEWNFDRENRESFSQPDGPSPPDILRFEPDEITREVTEQVDDLFPELSGTSDAFGWPVTPDQAHEALADFVSKRLPHFGTYQDAMWTGQKYLYHSVVAAAMNLRLLDPRHAVEAAVASYASGNAPLNSVEGFVRQIIGWREFIRGIYWLHQEKLSSGNALNATNDLPDFFWDGDTSMRCLSEVVQQLLETGYAHHIQRLMVAGLFCQLYGVDPKQVHDWFMALYVDSVEWVTLPNTAGMSQYADDGIVGTKPYIASGKYIDRMSNYCEHCRFDPGNATGDDACPFTTLYWDFIRRHEAKLESNGRTVLQVRNYQRKSPQEKGAITRRATLVNDMIADGQL